MVLPQNTGAATVATTTLGGGTQTLLTLNSSHVYFLVQNIGSTDVQISFSGVSATFNSGFLLKAGGGTLEFSSFIPTGSVTAYCNQNFTLTTLLA